MYETVECMLDYVDFGIKFNRNEPIAKHKKCNCAWKMNVSIHEEKCGMNVPIYEEQCRMNVPIQEEKLKINVPIHGQKSECANSLRKMSV